MLTCRIARIGLEAVERAAREQGVERSEFVRKALAKAVAEHDAKRGRR